ncbi:hypothetical protein PDTA9759_33270 [Phytobacter diazotrophicus]|uniref:Uncharacterized protein n=1 Tax=Phytobacter diazotrophicus TaxID=395631 RepID=A0ABN6LV29_9ENTR|nr:hypothetical protein MRY16398_35270 [Phytobacter sp. MRY16-398]BDD51844.1 hypothetical protein PDTA9734_33310 [Phytobacter diazotrophicus]BEG82773.1 hypothetical protein PDTA9730_32290 [Phytobacter diazotrophicus]BEG88671.1 hypothetical protein PDTA9759_33270 [Phytobacter diazotrophicus]BEG94435.1 hypothetical protein PDTA9832_32940 [Phytobacter diazotrophicus]
MTNNRTATAKYLAYNQGATTSTPINNYNRSTPAQAGSQPIIGQQTTQIQTNFRIK